MKYILSPGDEAATSSEAGRPAGEQNKAGGGVTYALMMGPNA